VVIANSFKDLGVSAELCRAVADRGYTQPTPIQAQAIPAILEGRDVFGGAQTGTGKTASFTLPLLQKNAASAKGSKRVIRSLIIVPTRELAAQVSDNVRKYGAHLPLKVVTVAGGIPLRNQIKDVKSVDILIATPGRLQDLLKRKSISLKTLETLVLDEADRMLDMGFMPAIREILALVPPKRQTLLFSATTNKQVEKLAQSILKKPLRIQVGERNQVSENVTHIAYFVAHKDKPAALVRLFKENSWSQVLIFTRTRADADRLEKNLKEREMSSRVIHSGKAQAVRTRTLKRFKNGLIKILIATEVAARGLDIESLPLVVNFELPEVPEDYIHRIGRTGRAGKKGTAISLVAKWERHRLFLIEKQIKKAFVREKLEGLEEIFTTGGKGKGKPPRKKFDPFTGQMARRSFPGRNAPRGDKNRKPADRKSPGKKPWDKMKPAYSKSSEQKPSERKSWDKKKPAYSKSTDRKPSERKPWDKKKPGYSKSTDRKPSERKPWDKKKPGYSKSTDRKPSERKPWDKKKPGYSKSTDRKPSERKPWDKKKPGHSKSTDRKPSERKPWEKKKPVHSKPVDRSGAGKKSWGKKKKEEKPAKPKRSGFERFYGKRKNKQR
jgi:ATP-dependent RNA helicase RhlE